MLVSVARYRAITLDTTSTDVAVTGALADAQDLLGEHLNREMESAERTETLRVWPDRRMYPLAAPITAVSDDSVEIVDTVTLRPSSISWDIWTTADPTSTVTYTGGWTEETVPARIERAIARVAAGLLVPAGVPAGVRAASVGDVSVTYDRPTVGLDELAPGVAASVRRWRRWVT